MKIAYDKLSSDYLYLLSKNDIAKVKSVVSPEVINKIRTLEFGCNLKTTQEGRVARSGSVYDIRINFCLKKLNSFILSDDNMQLSSTFAIIAVGGCSRTGTS